MTPEIDPAPGSIESLLADFISSHEDGRAVAVDVFCKGCPEAIRDDVRAHCESYLEARAVLSDSSPSSVLGADVERERLGDFRERRVRVFLARKCPV